MVMLWTRKIWGPIPLNKARRCSQPHTGPSIVPVPILMVFTMITGYTSEKKKKKVSKTVRDKIYYQRAWKIYHTPKGHRARSRGDCQKQRDRENGPGTLLLLGLRVRCLGFCGVTHYGVIWSMRGFRAQGVGARVTTGISYPGSLGNFRSVGGLVPYLVGLPRSRFIQPGTRLIKIDVFGNGFLPQSKV